MRVCSALLILLAASRPPQDTRLAIPEEAAVKEAEKTVRDLFKDDYAKKAPADRRALGRKLLGQGRETTNAPASQYVLLTQALDLATQAAAVDDALLALNELTNRFAVDPVATRVGAFAALAKAVKSPDEAKALAHAYVGFVDEALKADDFDAAGKAAAEGAAQARRAKEVPLVTAADAKTKEVAARKARFEKVRKAKELLVAMPDDPSANLALGQYYCFSKNDWAAGLACLAKGPDGNVKAIAIKDAVNPESPDDQAAVADGWWDLSETAPAEDKVAIRDRAGFWYSQAIKKIAGLGKVKVEKRLQQWNGERLARGAWLEYTDPGAFGLKGGPGKPLEVVHTTKGTATPVNSKPFPPGEYDGFTMRIRLKMEEPGLALHYKGPGQTVACGLTINGTARTIQMTGPNGPGTSPVQILPIAAADEYVLTMTSFKGDDTVFVNGVEIGRYPNPTGQFDSIGMYCRLGTTTIDKVRLRRRQ
jgi:hypothetical protein